MKALDYILKHYQTHDESNEPIIKALLYTLDAEELKTLQRKIVQCGFQNRYLSEKLCKEADVILKNTNVSIKQLLKDFESNNQIKVLVSRKKLIDRFDAQSHDIQIKIIRAFLHSSKKNRQWVYWRCYRSFWDDSLVDDFKNVWEKYKEKDCTKIIIEHFPIDYLIENMKSLYPDDNYEILCIRLRSHPSFNMEIDRLHKRYGDYDIGYLYVLANSNGTIEKGKASQILYKLIVHFINENKSIPNLYRYDASINSFLRFGEMSTTLFYDVEFVLCCMGKLGLVEELLSYRRWDKKVTRLYNRRKHLWEKEELFLKDEQQWKLYCSVIAECVPKEYKGLISSYVRSASATLPDFKACSI